MNKWSKLAQFVTLISTFIALGTVLFLSMNEQEAFPEKKFNEVVKAQTNQGVEIETFKKEVNTKIDTQNKVIIEYDNRIKEVEETQTEFLTIMADSQKEEPKKEEPKKEEPKKEEPKIEKPKTPKNIIVTSSDGLHLRKDSSDKSGSLGVLPKGTKVEVIGGPEDTGKYNWYKVKTAKGTIGWIAKEYTKE